MHFLWHMLDKTIKQTLCVMLVGHVMKPKKEDWDTMKEGDFYFVNGQYSVTASKMMV